MTGRPIARSDRCIDCGRLMRVQRVRIADAPGTVVHAAGGRCSGCWQHATGRRVPRDVRPPTTPQAAPPMPDAVIAAVKALCTRRAATDVLEILGIVA